MFFIIKVDRDESVEKLWSGWNLQEGYLNGLSSGTGHNSEITRETDRPLRAIAPGLHMGLSVMLDVKEEEYYCSGTESVGFKVQAGGFGHIWHLHVVVFDLVRSCFTRR